jgi:hypothetical protein
MSSSGDDIVQFRQGQFNYTKNRWVGTGSKNLNDVGAVPQPRTEALSDETSSIASDVSVTSNDCVQTTGSDNSVESNTSVGTSASVVVVVILFRIH